MKYDREEAYLHEKLTGGLHPAGVDLWPAVAEHLPDAPPARHPRWKLAICLATPLLIAAGVLAGTAEFTNLRENPRPSFAPEANTGYAITYERQYFALDEDLLAGMAANHNGETAADGTLPGSAGLSGYLHLDTADDRNRYSLASRGYDSWAELTEATGLPLAQNALLDAGHPTTDANLVRYPSGVVELPEDFRGGAIPVQFDAYRAGIIPVGRGETPDKLYLHFGTQLDDGWRVEMMAVAYLGDTPAETAAATFEERRSGLMWKCESYKMANGNTALIPHCTSNPTSMPWVQSNAYFAQDGILYKVLCLPTGMVWDDSQENIWAELKIILDGFA